MQMQNRMAVLLCNTRPAKMRGVASNAMIMCASSSDKVEVLDPPSGAVPGERVTFQGFPGMVVWLLYLQIQISHQHIYSHCPVIAKQPDHGNVGKKKVSFCWFEHKKEYLKNISGDKKIWYYTEQCAPLFVAKAHLWMDCKNWVQARLISCCWMGSKSLQSVSAVLWKAFPGDWRQNGGLAFLCHLCKDIDKVSLRAHKSSICDGWVENRGDSSLGLSWFLNCR